MAKICNFMTPPNASRIQSLNQNRGERLFPPKSSRVYWCLTELRRALESIAEELKSIRKGTLVDFGCGNMPYRPLFDGIVANYVACDFPGNEMASVLIGDDGRLPLPKCSAEIVLSSQVLEHAADPGLYLCEAYRVLKPGGYLLLSTHGVWRYHPDPLDLWRWTCEGLRREIETTGFSVVHLKGIMGPAATGMQIWQDAVLGHVPKMFRAVFTLVIQQMIAFADRRCLDENRDRDACVYVTLALKPTTQQFNEAQQSARSVE
jgi:SAM-dependent methyltransferase